MSLTVLIAGAAGVAGNTLLPLLVQAGFQVFGTTRKPERAAQIRAAGATPLILDVYDQETLSSAIISAAPDIIVNQLTDLPFGLAPEGMEEGKRRTAELRIRGTRNLIEAALASGTKRVISQSVAWAYEADNSTYIDEDTPIREDQSAIVALETATLHTPGIAGTVLRYGMFYGPGTGLRSAPHPISVHIADAARATLKVCQHRHDGVFNIVANDSPVSNSKAAELLGWRPIEPNSWRKHAASQ